MASRLIINNCQIILKIMFPNCVHDHQHSGTDHNSGFIPIERETIKPGMEQNGMESIWACLCFMVLVFQF